MYIDLKTVPTQAIVIMLESRGYICSNSTYPDANGDYAGNVGSWQDMLFEARDDVLIDYLKSLGFTVVPKTNTVMEVATDQMKLDDGVWSV